MATRRRGFTLVELLVVIVIIGLLMSLLLPAVQTARESARRVMCVNNIRQLAIAVQAHHTAFNRLPYSGKITKHYKNKPPDGPLFSWIVQILPQFERQTLYEEFDFSVPVYDQPTDPQAVHLSSLLCPSDVARYGYFLYKNKQFAKGNYAAYVTPYHVDVQERFPGALTSRYQNFDHITDGLTNTILLAEVRQRNDLLDQRGAWALPFAGSSVLGFDMHHDPMAGNTPFTYYWLSLGLTQRPNHQGPNADMLFACPDPSGAQLDQMPCLDASAGWISAAPRSNHINGVNIVFLDAHTSYLTDEVDEVVMAHLVSCNDGQVAVLEQ